MALSTGSKVFLVVLVVLLGGVGFGLYYVNDQLAGVPGEGEPVPITIEQGTSSARIGQMLEEQGVIKNALAFRLIVRAQGTTFLAGDYELETGMSVDEAIDALEEGPAEPESVRFTVREGLAVPLVLEELAGQFDQYGVDDFRRVLDERIQAGGNGEGVLELPDWVPPLGDFGAEVSHPFEGLLFPETYELFADATPQDILQRMIDQTVRVMSEVPQDQVRALGEKVQSDYSPEYTGLILASLIERETRVSGERPKVSSVIHNRLEAERPLEIDATVLYALGKWKERVLTEDTEVDSPYNTYPNPGDPNPGLPPTPISNAGRASIEAAFAPEDTPFLFYVLSPECDGTHQFAETLEGHNQNVAEFRDAGRCQEE
ncbi:MAG: endolytic transglycosylase MltG [Nitriliruptorales bacterium]|nr:endolytic transglycosylase MltG [Nitriliruptorales bacterium]